MANNRRTVLITGGRRGLGLEIARHFTGQRYRVVVLDILEEVGSIPADDGPEVDYYRVDLADPDQVASVIEKVLRKYHTIDVLINNAAMRLFKPLAGFDGAEIRRFIGVNFEATVMMAKSVYPSMKKNGYGRIINISSFSAFRGYSLGTIYCGTKSALNAFTEALARELRPDEGVTVNAICPDSFSTVEGLAAPDRDRTVRRIIHAIDSIIDSDRNGSIIAIAHTRQILASALHTFRRHLMWLLRH